MRFCDSIQSYSAIAVVVESVSPPQQQEWRSGLEAEDGSQCPAAYEAIKHAAAIRKLPAPTEWQVVSAVDMYNVCLLYTSGATVVIVLYVLANIAYLVTLPLQAIQHAPADRVGTATLRAIFPGVGTSVMAAAIMVSTFGTINALTLTGARVYYAMARQRLFFPFAGRLNSANVPASSLTLQGLWAAFLVLPRTYDAATKAWGNLYSNLLEYVISAALIFYVLTVAGVFRLRIKRPDAPRPYLSLIHI